MKSFFFALSVALVVILALATGALCHLADVCIALDDRAAELSAENARLRETMARNDAELQIYREAIEHGEN